MYRGMGTYLQVKSIEKKSFDGRTYYLYEANANYGTLGPHTLTMVTTKVTITTCLHPLASGICSGHCPWLDTIKLQKRTARREALTFRRHASTRPLWTEAPCGPRSWSCLWQQCQRSCMGVANPGTLRSTASRAPFASVALNTLLDVCRGTSCWPLLLPPMTNSGPRARRSFAPCWRPSVLQHDNFDWLTKRMQTQC